MPHGQCFSFWNYQRRPWQGLLPLAKRALIYRWHINNQRGSFCWSEASEFDGSLVSISQEPKNEAEPWAADDTGIALPPDSSKELIKISAPWVQVCNVWFAVPGRTLSFFFFFHFRSEMVTFIYFFFFWHMEVPRQGLNLRRCGDLRHRSPTCCGAWKLPQFSLESPPAICLDHSRPRCRFHQIWCWLSRISAALFTVTPKRPAYPLTAGFKKDVYYRLVS